MTAENHENSVATPPRAGDVADGALESRRGLRRAWGVSDSDRLVLALPPVTRAAGTAVAAWGMLLAQKAMPELRLVMPAGDREFDRVRRLFNDVGARSTLLTPISSLALTDCVAACDAAIFVPIGPTDDGSLETAARFEMPLIVSERAAGTVAGRAGVWSCRANDPKDAARAILGAFGRVG